MFRWAIIAALFQMLTASLGYAQNEAPPGFAESEAPSEESIAAEDTTDVTAESIADARAEQLFDLGRQAFDAKEFETALDYFRRSHDLSQRPELLYDIGVAADRLRRDNEALAAFERYLAEVEEPERENEVRDRVEALRRIISTPPSETDVGPVRNKKRRAAIIGAPILIAAGAAGVGVMSYALARDGRCLETVDTMCVRQDSRTKATWAYGALGAAAMVGGAVWLGVALSRGKKERATTLRFTPGGIAVSGEF